MDANLIQWLDAVARAWHPSFPFAHWCKPPSTIPTGQRRSVGELGHAGFKASPRLDAQALTLTIGRTWYIAPIQRYGDIDAAAPAKPGDFDDSGQVWDPSDSSAPLGADIDVQISSGAGPKKLELHDGRTPKTAFATIERLLQGKGVCPRTGLTWTEPLAPLARPGDTIILTDGIYDTHPIYGKGDKSIGLGPKEASRLVVRKLAESAPTPTLPVSATAQTAKLVSTLNQVAVQKELVSKYVERRIFAVIDRGGDPGKPLTIRAMNPGKAIIWGGDHEKVPWRRAATGASRGMELRPGPAGRLQHLRISGLVFRNASEAIVEVGTGDKHLGMRNIEIRDCRFMDGRNHAVAALQTQFAYPFIETEVTHTDSAGKKLDDPRVRVAHPAARSALAGAVDPLGNPIFEKVAGGVALVSGAALHKLQKAWAVGAWKAWTPKKAASDWKLRDPVVITAASADGGLFLRSSALRHGLSTVTMQAKSRLVTVANCHFGRVSGLADNWYIWSAKDFPFADLGYRGMKLPGDWTNVGSNYKPFYVAATVFGRTIPLCKFSSTATLNPIPWGETTLKSPPTALRAWVGLSHGVYLMGAGQTIENCTFENVGMGFAIRVGPWRVENAKQTKQPSHDPILQRFGAPQRTLTIRNCRFHSVAGRHLKSFVRFAIAGASSGPQVGDRPPHRALIEGCVFDGAPGDVPIAYLGSHSLGRGLMIRFCRTNTRFLTWNTNRPFRRVNVKGIWLVALGEEQKGLGKGKPAYLSTRQAYDTPWQLRPSLIPLTELQPLAVTPGQPANVPTTVVPIAEFLNQRGWEL